MQPTAAVHVGVREEAQARHQGADRVLRERMGSRNLSPPLYHG